MSLAAGELGARALQVSQGRVVLLLAIRLNRQLQQTLRSQGAVREPIQRLLQRLSRLGGQIRVAEQVGQVGQGIGVQFVFRVLGAELAQQA